MKTLFGVIVFSVYAQAAYSEEHIITQKDKLFSKESLTVKVGEKIVFKNNDNTPHNVFSTSAGNAFNLKIQKPGESHEKVFTTPGDVEVRCAIHPKMLLKVKVQ